MLNKEFEIMVDKMTKNLGVPELNYVIGRLRETCNRIAILKDENLEGVPEFEMWVARKLVLKKLAFLVCKPEVEFNEVENFYDVTLSMIAKIPYSTLLKTQGIGKKAIDIINDVLIENGFNPIENNAKS
jgi:hypothetical protein